MATAEDDLDLLTACLPCTPASDLDLVTLGLDWNSRGGGRGETVETLLWTAGITRFREEMETLVGDRQQY